ncbi:MAG: DUF5011 domain-containing protein [Acholeplasmataceae bacterium]|nr:DUF5011 domain-containing protein [Acholeplasmataceae bacterium]
MKKLTLFFILLGGILLTGCTPNDGEIILPQITLNGENEVTINVDQDFIDLGAVIVGDFDLEITVDSDLDNTTPGTYHITYTTIYEGTTYNIIRTIIVVSNDSISPTITLNGEAIIHIEFGGIYSEENATFSDNLDLTGNVVIGGDTVDTSVLGTYIVTYNATDENGNAAIEVTRTVIVEDTIDPILTLNGEATINVQYGSVYEDLGAQFSDNADQTGNVTIGGDVVDTNTLGTYIVTYNTADTSGNLATEITRTVIVEDTQAPTITLINNATYYVEYLATYTEPGAAFNDNYDTTGTVTIGGDTVDSSVLATYIITYDAIDTNDNESVQVTRPVIVTDMTSPVTTLTGDSTVYVEFGVAYVEQGAIFTDNYDDDGDAIITSSSLDENELGTYTITYRATDAHGNISQSVTRTVIVEDTTGPTIDLNGNYVVYVNLDDDYEELGAEFSDNYDQTGSVVIGGDTVDTSTIGDYIITYNAVDSHGNNANEVTRTVSVVLVNPTVENPFKDIRSDYIGISFDLVDDYDVYTDGYIRLMVNTNTQVSKTDITPGHLTFIYDTGILDNEDYTIEVWAYIQSEYAYKKIYSTSFVTPPDISLTSFEGEETFYSLDHIILKIDLSNIRDYDIDYVTINYDQYDIFKYPSDNETIYVDMGSHSSGTYNYILNSVGVIVNYQDYLYDFDSEISIEVYLPDAIDPLDATLELLDITNDQYGNQSFVKIPTGDTSIVKNIYFHFDNPYNMVVTSLDVWVAGTHLELTGLSSDDQDPLDANVLIIPVELYKGDNYVRVVGYTYLRNEETVAVTLDTTLNNNLIRIYSIVLADTDTIQLYSIGDVQAMTSTGNYVLMNDIDMGNSRFYPIGSYETPFTGTFDGNGHTISNFYIQKDYTSSGATGYFGFFGYVQGAFIADFTLENITMTINSVESNNDVHAGILLGEAWYTTVMNVDITGNSSITVNQLTGGLYGGLAGFMAYPSGQVIKDNHVNVDINITTTSTDNQAYILRVGGLIGLVYTYDIKQSSATGSINITNVNQAYTGGLVGEIGNDGGSSNYNYIYNSYANVDITSTTNDVYSATGGLVGVTTLSNRNGTIIYNSFATGDISAGRYNVGGLIGYSTGYIYNSFSTGNLSIISGYLGGISGNQNTLTYVKLENNFVYSGRTVIKNGNPTGTIDQYFDAFRLRQADVAQFDDPEFYTHVVGLNEYYFDFTGLDFLAGHYPTLN